MISRTKIFSVLFPTLFFFSASASATTDVGGRMQEDTTWSAAGSPYILTQSLIIEEGVTLTIEPGVRVELANQSQPSDNLYGISVRGELIARGREDDPIRFASAREDPAAGDWGSISFSETAAGAEYTRKGEYEGGSILEYVTIEHGGGTDTAAVSASSSAPFLNNVTIRHNSQSGIGYEDVREAYIAGSIFSDNIAEKGGAVFAEGSSVVITNSAFADNTNTDILFTSEKGGTIYCASSSLTVENCIFSGGISDKGGSIYFSSSLVSFARSKLSFCTFSNNIAREEGGAVHHASLSVASSLTIDNCTFIANTAGGEGGAIYHDASSLTLNSSALAYNQGETALTMSSGTIERCTIVNNLPALDSEEDTPQDGIAVTAALLMSGSNLFGHSRYDLYNDSETDISATGNYWGTIDSSEIDRKIFDFLDNTEKGEVLYEPLLSDISHDAPEIPEEPTTTTSSIPGGTSTTTVPDDNTTTIPATSSSTTTTAVEGTQITVDFGASPTSGSAPLQVQFKNLTESKTVISSYLWDFGDGSFSSESEPVHSYAKKGTYGVQLTAYATDGTSAEVFKENYIEVEQSVLPQVAFWTIIILLLFIVLL